jgi:hypothetical protein
MLSTTLTGPVCAEQAFYSVYTATAGPATAIRPAHSNTANALRQQRMSTQLYCKRAHCHSMTSYLCTAYMAAIIQ